MKKVSHCKTHFSIGESIITPKKLPTLANEVGNDGIVVCDTMSIDALVDINKACKEIDMPYVIGCNIRVVDDPALKVPFKQLKGENTPVFIKAFAKNKQGVTDIMEVITKGFDPDYFYHVPRVGWYELYQLIGEGNVDISLGDTSGIFMRSDSDSKIEHLERLLDAQNCSLYADLVAVDSPYYNRHNLEVFKRILDPKFNIKPLLSHPSYYEKPEHADTLDVMLAITRNMKLDDNRVPKQPIKEFYVRNLHDDLKPRYEKFKAAMNHYGEYTLSDLSAVFANAAYNSSELLDNNAYTFENQEVTLPDVTPDDKAELFRLVKEGWDKRVTNPVFGHKPSEEELQVYKDRLKYEMSVLLKMDFVNYFVMVADIVNWSKSNGILVGPGRGSVGGSLVAYLMGITDVDPIRFDLIFERFINPERIDLPDIDLDFMTSRRHEVIEYIREKYGDDRVAGISNYSTFQSSSAMREAGRMFGLSPKDMNATKLVPKEHGISIELEQAAELVPEIGKFKKDHPVIWNHALVLDGKLRAYGQHAAGVVVSKGELKHHAVIKRNKGTATVNWDKRNLEDFGLVKLDVLGLSTLDTIRKTLEYINERGGSSTLDLLSVELDDPAVLKAFAEGKTVGVFQFESHGMRNLLKRLGEDGDLNFEDLVAANALYRPGPMDSGLLDDYVDIKQGVKSEWYDHPNMENALKATRGVIVYQEQVMQIARDLAGFTFAEADVLRKAMGKKSKELMAKQKEKFVDGAVEHSEMPAAEAGALFDKIEKFAGYGFNRSHAVEYSLISYIAMYLKVNHPTEFIAAAMSVAEVEDKLFTLTKEAHEMGIEIHPPNINVSSNRFEIPTSSGSFIVAPFNRLKGLSENSAKYIIEQRNGIPFADMDDFDDRVARRKCNKNMRAVLERVGAFSMFEGQLPAICEERKKDQMELMPGLIHTFAKATREMEIKKKGSELEPVFDAILTCKDCDLYEQEHALPNITRHAKFMIVKDYPNKYECNHTKMSCKDDQYLATAFAENGRLLPQHAYVTALTRSHKKGKFVSPDQINACGKYLDKEIEITKPPVILALGSSSIRHLTGGAVTGNWEEIIGRTYYNKDLDATIVCGFNSSMIYFDASRQSLLNKLIDQVEALL